jgi:hypothetical protein
MNVATILVDHLESAVEEAAFQLGETLGLARCSPWMAPLTLPVSKRPCHHPAPVKLDTPKEALQDAGHGNACQRRRLRPAKCHMQLVVRCGAVRVRAGG